MDLNIDISLSSVPLIGGSTNEGDETPGETTQRVSRDAPAAAELETPISPGIVAEARQEASLPAVEGGMSLVEVLNEIQLWTEQQEYAEPPGNAFLEDLVTKFRDDDSLSEPVRVVDGEVTYILLAEGWAEIQRELDLYDAEVEAARDAHQLYASAVGLDAYAAGVNLLTIQTTPPRAKELLEQTDTFVEQVEFSTESPSDSALPNSM